MGKSTLIYLKLKKLQENSLQIYSKLKNRHIFIVNNNLNVSYLCLNIQRQIAWVCAYYNFYLINYIFTLIQSQICTNL